MVGWSQWNWAYRLLAVIGDLYSGGAEPPYSKNQIRVRARELGLEVPPQKDHFGRLLDFLLKEKLIQVRKKGKEFLIYPTTRTFELQSGERKIQGIGNLWGGEEYSLAGSPLYRTLKFLESQIGAVEEDEITKRVRPASQWGYTPLDRLEYQGYVSSSRPGHFEITKEGREYLRWMDSRAKEKAIKKALGPGEVYRPEWSPWVGLERAVVVGDPDYARKSEEIVFEALESAYESKGKSVRASEVQIEARSKGFQTRAPRTEELRTISEETGEDTHFMGGRTPFDMTSTTLAYLRGLGKKGKIEMRESKGRYYFSPVKEKK